MSLYGAIPGLATGDRLYYGQATLGTGTASVVVPKLDPGERIKAIVYLGIDVGTAPLTTTVTGTISAMTLSIFGWKPTNATTTTLIATTENANIDYAVIVGR